MPRLIDIPIVKSHEQYRLKLPVDVSVTPCSCRRTANADDVPTRNLEPPNAKLIYTDILCSEPCAEEYKDEIFLKTVNFIVGRFQPLTNGHTKCCESGKNINGRSTVLCMVESDITTPTKPFPTRSMYLIYKNFIDTYHPYGIEDIILVKSANIIHVSEQLAKNGYIGDMWLCGSDRFKSYQLMLNKYKDRCPLAESTDVFEVYRPKNEISATKIREYIKVRDFEWFCHGTPFKKYAGEEYAAFIYNELCRFIPSLANSGAIDLSKIQENEK